jgi:hypothetical protein
MTSTIARRSSVATESSGDDAIVGRGRRIGVGKRHMPLEVRSGYGRKRHEDVDQFRSKAWTEMVVRVQEERLATVVKFDNKNTSCCRSDLEWWVIRCLNDDIPLAQNEGIF